MTVRPAPGARTAIVCSVLDQGVAALTNILVLVVAARLSSAAGFSVFSMVYTVFSVLLGVSVSYVGQALVLERGEAASVAAACRSAASFVAVASAVAGGAMAAGLAFVPGETAWALAVLGMVLPLVLTQDGLRYCFSTLRLPHLALTSDVLRLAVALPALALQPHGTGPARLVAVWGLSAVPALLVGAALLAPGCAAPRPTCGASCAAGTSGSASSSSTASATPPASSRWSASVSSPASWRWARCAVRRRSSAR